MSSLYSKANKKVIDSYFNDPKVRELVENDLGLPIKVRVDWENGMISVQGKNAYKKLKIKDILDAYELIEKMESNGIH